MFTAASRNWVSVIFIVNVAIINIIEWKQKKDISVWPSFLAFIISIYAVGRSGIICSGFLFLGLLFSKISHSKNGKKWISFIITLLFLITILFWQEIVETFNYYISFSRFAAEGFESNARKDMLLNYIKNIDLYSFVLGYNYNNDPFFISWNLNPHNSFIRLHYNTGIFFILIVSSMIYVAIKLFFTSKYLFVIIVALILRGLTDTIFFMDRFDFIFVGLFLIHKHFEYETTD